MRRLLIQRVLPLAFTLVPLLAAALVAVAIPVDALRDYWNRVSNSAMDWLILGLGSVLFTAQLLLSWRALQWRGSGFDERADKWLSSLAQTAEWFPLLGLIGTVAAILQTFSSFAADGEAGPQAAKIIRSYAPAITATGSGLFMAFINILPSWVVNVGRDVIRSLGGYEADGKVSP